MNFAFVKFEIMVKKCSGSGVRGLDIFLFLISYETIGADKKPFIESAFFINSLDIRPKER